ncbi:hypothetical protein ONE63_000670 [Megalurothrips usitatus]|uniref:Cytochrome b-c1 complex subunit 7 n=1 Tax=Megalurothrips usitatus TaxID=439358 RepID=A0AAV7Y697_9NEOP|nr:hypothetical protein ONE63_000670 [Megalurothrips usitatus]
MRIVRALFRAAQAAPKEFTSFERFTYRANGYCKYGLLQDDLLSEHCDKVVEALRRLGIRDEEALNQRIWRHNRAAYLSMTHTILPESEWTKIEDDKPYVSDLLEEIEAEKLEKSNWEENNPL